MGSLTGRARAKLSVMRYVAIALLFLQAACSTTVVELAAPMTIVDGDVSYTVINDVTIDARRAAPTVIRSGTTWRQIGTIEQGNVFDTKDQVVIVNSFNVEEAAIVTNNQTVVGYYLKVSGAFVEVDPMPIILKPQE